MKLRLLLHGFAAIALVVASNASGIALDPTFRPVLRDFGSSGNGFPSGNISVVQPDGKILVGGRFTVANGVARSGIVRFNADYTLDTSFNAGDFSVAEVGVFTSSGGFVYTIKLQSDGKIVIGGSFQRGDDTAIRSIERLNSDGSTDATFQPVTSAVLDGSVGDLEIQPDGKIVFGGSFEVTTTNPTTGQGVTFTNLARVNSDGSFDFGFTGQADEFSNNIVLLPDGKIAVGNSQFSAQGGIRVVRYNANGTFNATLATITDGFGIEALELQPDGKLILAGSINYVDDVFKKRIARLNVNGGLDSSFDVVDTLNGTIYDILINPSGAISIVGDFFIYDGAVTQYYVARLTPTGTRDTSFNIDRRIAGIPSDINVLPNGQYLLAGAFPITFDPVNFNHFYENLALVNSNGTVDTSHNIAFSVTEQGGVFDIQQQPDGKILVGGEFQFAEAVSRRSLARYNTDGSLDATFDTLGNISIVSSFAQQSDGKILVANGGGTVNLQRLNSDGAIDGTFTSPFVSFSSSIQQRTVIRSVLLQPDGKILVGGKLITGSATSPTLSGLVRLNPNGSRDTSFQIVFARGGTRYVNDIALQADGKVVFGGDFTNIGNDTSYTFLGRANADGTIDTSFRPTPVGAINEIELQADGKIVFGGYFGAIRRVNPDGTADSLNVPVNDSIFALTVQPDNQIIVGGMFTMINNVARTRIARLANDGTVDPSFTASANSTIYDITLQGDGRILLGGQFTRIDSVSRLAAARIGADVLQPLAVVSRKTHGAAGTFGIPLTGAANVECRSGGAGQNYELVFTFPSAVTTTGATATPGAKDKNAAVAGVAGSGTSEIVVSLMSVSDAQTVNVKLLGVSNGTGSSNDVSIPFSILIGDTNGNRSVNATDIGQTKAESGVAVSASNFRNDINVSGGSISASDISQVKANAGQMLP